MIVNCQVFFKMFLDFLDSWILLKQQENDPICS